MRGMRKRDFEIGRRLSNSSDSHYCILYACIGYTFSLIEFHSLLLAACLIVPFSSWGNPDFFLTASFSSIFHLVNSSLNSCSQFWKHTFQSVCHSVTRDTLEEHSDGENTQETIWISFKEGNKSFCTRYLLAPDDEWVQCEGIMTSALSSRSI